MSKTTYKITIIKIEHDVPYIDKSWKQLRDEPNEKHENLYDYVTTESVKDVETQVFSQVVEELDLPKVVKTINPGE